MENSNAMQNIERALEAIARAIAGERSPSGNLVELGRSTLTAVSDSISVTLSDSTYRYLIIKIGIQATGGTTDTFVYFNSDTGTNYAVRYSAGHAAETTAASNAGIPIESGATDSGQPMFCIMEVLNYKTDEKLFRHQSISGDAAGAATLPAVIDMQGKWANQTDYISTVTITNTGGTGDFAVGSEMVVLGHN